MTTLRRIKARNGRRRFDSGSAVALIWRDTAHRSSSVLHSRDSFVAYLFMECKKREAMESAAYFLEKAAQCRRLAGTIVDQKDPAVQGLLRLAEEFEAQAATYVAREKTAHTIGLGDDVVPVKPPTE